MAATKNEGVKVRERKAGGDDGDERMKTVNEEDVKGW